MKICSSYFSNENFKTVAHDDEILSEENIDDDEKNEGNLTALSPTNADVAPR